MKRCFGNESDRALCHLEQVLGGFVRFPLLLRLFQEEFDLHARTDGGKGGRAEGRKGGKEGRKGCCEPVLCVGRILNRNQQ